jgi:hypothetical protein
MTGETPRLRRPLDVGAGFAFTGIKKFKKAFVRMAALTTTAIGVIGVGCFQIKPQEMTRFYILGLGTGERIVGTIPVAAGAIVREAADAVMKTGKGLVFGLIGRHADI